MKTLRSETFKHLSRLRSKSINIVVPGDLWVLDSELWVPTPKDSRWAVGEFSALLQRDPTQLSAHWFFVATEPTAEQLETLRALSIRGLSFCGHHKQNIDAKWVPTSGFFSMRAGAMVPRYGRFIEYEWR